ncbi:hypothetical protein B0H17DRAFT_1326589 [Mycena rosella]|uniref:Arf-GAP domain-containing protein n=1 Tax=Mycena rosella TaxID=1033263 RepID=A0AAD7GSP2_MYCRO|nr:hypothetical protein B0H17DRAFT_1326589 [Mycena rosella]
MALNKVTIERNQRTLLDLVAQPGNDVCADCKVKNPRWASHNLGIFICVSCASVHRKIGTHVTKVKSLTMDSWTREQTENMRQNGNMKSNQLYNPNEARHPPPPNLMDGERDSEMEQFIRSKYEYKSFIDKSSLVASKLGPSRSMPSRPSPSPANGSSGPSTTPSVSALPPSVPPVRSNTTVTAPKMTPTRSLSQPLAPPVPQPQQQFSQPPQQMRPQAPQQQTQQAGGVWNDLISLQAPGSSSSLPLQFQPSSAPFQGFGQQQPINMSTGYQPQMANPTGMGMGMMGGMSANPYQSQFAPSTSYSSQMQQPQFTPSFSSPSFGGAAAPMYNPPQHPQQQQQQQQLFQGQPVQSPVPQGFGYQQPGPTPTYGNQMLGANQFASSSPQPFMSGSPQPGPQFMSGSPQPPFMSSSPQPGPQFMGSSPQPPFQSSPQPSFQSSPQPPFQSSPQPPFQQYGGGMQQGQQWMGGANMGYQQQQQQQHGQWGGGM